MRADLAFGMAAVVLSLADAVPYLRDVLRGRTVPHRGSWLVWTVLGFAALSAQTGAGGGWSIAPVAVHAVTIAVVFVLSLRRGEGGTGPVEVALLGLAAAGLVGWAVSDDPFVALACIVGADVTAFALLVPKSWRDPWSETTACYALAGAAGVCAVLSLDGATATTVLYPAYFAVANLATAAMLTARRRRLSRYDVPETLPPALLPVS